MNEYGAGGRLGDRQRRGDQDETGDSIRVFRGEDERLAHVAPGDDDGAGDACRVHHGDRDRRPTHDARRRAGSDGAIGATVAGWIERDDAEVAREVRDLRLPAARVDDLPRRQQQHRSARRRRRPRSAEPHTVALDEPADVRLPCSHRGYTSSAIDAAARAAPPVSTGR